MTSDEFIKAVSLSVTPGIVWCGPKGGRKEIIDVQVAKGELRYWQGKNKSTKISINLEVAWQVVENYRGKKLSSVDLRRERPRTFDSKNSGHNCNCITLFQVLQKLGLVTEIRGTGQSGNPCYVVVPLSLKVVVEKREGLGR